MVGVAVEGGGGSPALTVAVQRCPTLQWLTVPPDVGAWPVGSLARLQRLEVVARWLVGQIPATLAHLAVSNSTRRLPGEVVVAEAEVEVPALESDRNHAWLTSPRVRLDKADVSGPGLMRVLQAARVLQLAPLRARSTDAAAFSVSPASVSASASVCRIYAPVAKTLPCLQIASRADNPAATASSCGTAAASPACVALAADSRVRMCTTAPLSRSTVLLAQRLGLSGTRLSALTSLRLDLRVTSLGGLGALPDFYELHVVTAKS